MVVVLNNLGSFESRPTFYRCWTVFLCALCTDDSRHLKEKIPASQSRAEGTAHKLFISVPQIWYPNDSVSRPMRINLNTCEKSKGLKKICTSLRHCMTEDYVTLHKLGKTSIYRLKLLLIGLQTGCVKLHKLIRYSLTEFQRAGRCKIEVDCLNVLT